MGKRITLSRARVTLAWALACFATSQLGLSLFLHLRRPEVIEREYNLQEASLRARLARSRESLVLVLGSSRPSMGIAPAAFPALQTANGRPAMVFNFSLLGAGPLSELMSLRRLLSRGVRPDWVLIEVWAPFLVDGPTFDEEKRFAPSQLCLADLPVVFRHFSHPWDVCREFFEGLAIPAVSQRMALLRSFGPRWLFQETNPKPDPHWGIPDDSGWRALPAPPPSREDYRRRVALVSNYFRPILSDSYRIRAGSDHALRDLIELCRNQGIKLALFVMPEARCFQTNYQATVSRQFQDYLESLHRQYNVPVIDTRDWASDEDFFEGFHLVRSGALAFSQRFGREVLLPLLAGQNVPGGWGRERMPGGADTESPSQQGMQHKRPPAPARASPRHVPIAKLPEPLRWCQVHSGDMYKSAMGKEENESRVLEKVIGRFCPRMR